jgi:hypothetical protein
MGGALQSAGQQAAQQQPQAGSDAARAFEQFQAAQALGQGQAGPGGSQSVAPQQQMGQISGSPYSQQTSQEDPRMQAMRFMQQMGGRF